MNKYILSIMLAFIAGSLFAQVVPAKISSMEAVYDFGDVVEGQMAEHDFIVTNTGGSILEIQKVKASCGCTAANPEKEKLEPGESTKIKVSFNSQGRQGVQKKYVYVFSNDPEIPQYRLEFSVNVVQKTAQNGEAFIGAKLILSKTQHNFGKVKEGEQLTLKVLIKNAGKEMLKISNVETSCGCTATNLSSKEIAPGIDGSIIINLDTSGRKGEFTRTVTIRSNDTANPVQTIVLFVNIEERT